MDVPQRLKTGQFESFADSIIPLVDGKTVKGAAYLFRDEGRFSFLSTSFQVTRERALEALIGRGNKPSSMRRNSDSNALSEKPMNCSEKASRCSG